MAEMCYRCVQLLRREILLYRTRKSFYKTVYSAIMTKETAKNYQFAESDKVD